MNKTLIFLVSAAMVCAAPSSHGQNFTDLNFESAQIIPASTNTDGSINIATANALPGWNALFGTNQLPLIPYDQSHGGIAPAVSLLGGSQDPPIDGNFDISLHGGSIVQTAMVPANAVSLFFDAAFGYSQPFTVSLDGQDLSYSAIANGVNSSGLSYTVYGGDISAYAGQIETLTFSTGAGSSGGILDNIQFSPTPVPEPSTIPLSCLSIGILILFPIVRRLKLKNEIPDYA